MQNRYNQIAKLLTLSFLSVFLTSWSITQPSMKTGANFTQANYEISLALSFSGQGEEAILEAYVPTSDDRQHIREIKHELAGFDQKSSIDDSGQRIQWRHGRVTGPQTIRYTFQFSGSAAVYDIPSTPGSVNYSQAVKPYLRATPSVPSENSFIRRQASELAEQHQNLPAILDAFYAYSSRLPAQPGPAFAALFYGRKDWKNYLFMALCRAEGIPARVVNGLEIETNGAYQMRQWAELYVGGVWIPFDLGAQHFAYLPDNYLTLYRGEAPALEYSANLMVSTEMEILPKQGLIGAR